MPVPVRFKKMVLASHTTLQRENNVLIYLVNLLLKHLTKFVFNCHSSILQLEENYMLKGNAGTHAIDGGGGGHADGDDGGQE